MTAVIGLYRRLELPEPFRPATAPLPLIVYGASGAVGSFVIKLAQASNIHPIIAVAGRAQSHVEKLITRSRGDTIVDYRNGDDAVVAGIKDALKSAGAGEVKHAFDTVSEHNSYQNISKVMAREDSKITLVLPGKDYNEIPAHITVTTTMVGDVHADVTEEEKKNGIFMGGKDMGFVYFRLFARGLKEGWFTGHPYEVIPGGLGGVATGLKNLQAGKASAVKYIYKIEDTKA